MRTILSILFSLICFIGFAQKPIVTNRSTPSSFVIDSRWGAGLNMKAPVYDDTTAASTVYALGLDSAGSIIFTRDSSFLWVRHTGKYWQKVGFGSANSDTIFFETPLRVVDNVVYIDPVSEVDSGYVTPAMFIKWNQKVDSVSVFEDTIYYFINEERNLAGVVSGFVDSVKQRGDTLRYFVNGDSTLIGTVSGGGGGNTIYTSDGTIIDENRTVTFYGSLGSPKRLQFKTPDKESGFWIDSDGTNIVDEAALGSPGFDAGVKWDGMLQKLILGWFGVIPGNDSTPIYIGSKLRNDENYNDSALVIDSNGLIKKRGISGSGITTTQLTDSLNAREPRYKFRDDSTGNAGYTTLYQRNKLKDSLQANIDLKADTSNQTFTGRNTFTSTSSGVIIPRVTTAQMDAISSPTHGEIVYNTDEGATFYYTTDWGWMSDAPEWKRRSGVEQFSEFILQPTSTNTQTDFFTTALANSGTIGSATAVSNRPGIYQFSTSTSSNARSSIVADPTYASNVLLGGGQLMYETDVQIPTLSNSTETFRFFVGLSNNPQAVSVSSVAFLYDSAGVNGGSAATGNWQVVCANASTRSYTTTSVPVVAGQWYRLKAVVNAAATQVQFYIDGTLVRTETSNIPATGVTPMAVLTKSNGTTARTALIDWFFFKQKFTTQR